MHQYYEDILSRIIEPPTWFDDHGVPRFGGFSPRHLSDIYAFEAALAEVSCQQCGRMFRVALTEAFASSRFSLSDEIRLARAHYGDPPNVRCCWPGPTMGSVMHRILEYWFLDHEVSMGWQRDPTFEGPVAEAPLDSPDTVAEVLAAVGAGAMTIGVRCTSRRSRYDLAGRITARMASDGQVLLTYPENYSVVARKMLHGLVPDTEVGSWKDGRAVTLSDFSCLKEGRFAMIERVVILAAPRPLNGAAQEVWDDAAARLATEARGKVRVELALAHSCCTIANPDIIIDGGRTGEPE